MSDSFPDVGIAVPTTALEVTFGELWDVAGVIAYQLRHTWGVSKGQRVALCYPYGPNVLSALLGCWRAGVAALLVEAPDKRKNKVKFQACLDQVRNRINNCDPIAMVLTDKRTFKTRNSNLANILNPNRSKWFPALEWRETESLNPYESLRLKVGVFPRAAASTRAPSSEVIPAPSALTRTSRPE